VKADTKRKLDLVGRKGETYDAIIRKLIESYLRANGSLALPLDVQRRELN
jgi:hypothetical protein